MTPTFNNDNVPKMKPYRTQHIRWIFNKQTQLPPSPSYSCYPQTPTKYTICRDD
jgi:hypothetical protein